MLAGKTPFLATDILTNDNLGIHLLGYTSNHIIDGLGDFALEQEQSTFLESLS